MNHLKIRALVIISLVALALIAVAGLPTKYHQEFSQNDMYEMSEPFSSDPLVTYSSMESSPSES